MLLIFTWMIYVLVGSRYSPKVFKSSAILSRKLYMFIKIENDIPRVKASNQKD